MPISALRPNSPTCAPRPVASRQRRFVMRLRIPKPARRTMGKAKELPFSLNPPREPSFPAYHSLEPTGGVIPPGGGPLAKATLARRRHWQNPGTCARPTSYVRVPESQVSSPMQTRRLSRCLSHTGAFEISRHREMNQPRIQSSPLPHRETPPSQTSRLDRTNQIQGSALLISVPGAPANLNKERKLTYCWIISRPVIGRRQATFRRGRY